MGPSEKQLEAFVDQAASRVRSPRSCVVALSNCTGLHWKLDAVAMRRGDLGAYPPPAIAPWSFGVFSARCLAAHIGAGCGGTARYRSADGHAVDLWFDVPYAGRADAHVAVYGPDTLSTGKVVRPANRGGAIVFFLQVTALTNPSITHRNGAPAR